MNTNGDMAARNLHKVEHRADDERGVIDEIDEVVAGISDAEVDEHLRRLMRRVNGRKAWHGVVQLADLLIEEAAQQAKDPSTGGAPRSGTDADPADRQTEHDPIENGRG